MSKGQIISGDFIVGMAIFILILAIVVPLFTNLSEDREQRNLIDDIQTRSVFVTDMLLKTDGIPSNWNHTNVRRIGFVNENSRLNITKIRNFLKMDPGQAKVLLGLGDLEFNLSLHHENQYVMSGVSVSPAAYFYVNDNKIFEAINGSGLVWDLYYGGGGSPAAGDARNIYTGPKAAIFDAMFANSSLYKTVIIENSELTQGEINLTALQYFLSSGGLLIVEGDADIISTGFSMSSGTNPGGSGNLTDVNFIEAPLGSVITFTSSSWYFFNTSSDSRLHIIAGESPGQAYIGSWDHDIGKIYYLTDIEGTVAGNELINVTNLVGRKVELATGQMETALVNTRSVVMDRELNSLGKVVFVVGR